MAAYHSKFITDLSAPPILRQIQHQFAMGDKNAYTFTALVCDHADPEAGLLAGTVSGSLLRPDGGTVALEGEKGGAVVQVRLGDGTLCNATPCSVTLPQACFAYPGRVVLTVKLVDSTDNAETQVLIVSGTVVRTTTDEIVDPGEIIPDVSAIQAAAAEALDAAADARSAAQQAVRYDEAQTLTDTQKETARKNIAAQGLDVAAYDEAMSMVGKYTIQKSDMESGLWAYSVKSTDTTKARCKFLIPVRAGMIVEFSTTAYNVYFGILSSPTASSYVQTLNWRTGTASFGVSADGYMTFNIQNKSNTSSTVDPSAYNATVTVYAEDVKNVEAAITNNLAYNKVAEEFFPGNLIVPSECILYAYLSTTTGNPIYSSSGLNMRGFFVTNFFPVTPGEEYVSNFPEAQRLVYYNSSKAFLSGSMSTVLTSFTPPTGAAYARFTVGTHRIATPYLLYTYKKSDYVAHITERITKHGGYTLTADDMESGYWSYSTKVGSTTRLRTRYLIPVKAGMVVQCQNPTMKFYMGILGSVSASSYLYLARHTGDDASWLPAGGHYEFRIPCDGYMTIILESASTVTVSDYDSLIVIRGIDTMWTARRVANWIGDSIVANYDADDIVCVELGLQENDYGINGSTLAQRDDSTTAQDPIVNRYVNMDDNADIIAVSAGTNDWGSPHIRLGNPTDTAITTFYGALNTMMPGLMTKYPGKIIFFTTPLKRAADGGNQETQDAFGNTLKDYRDAIIERGAYWGVPVLDLWGESGLNPCIAAHAQFFSTDLLHPNEKGRLVIARRMTGWLKQLGSQNVYLRDLSLPF